MIYQCQLSPVVMKAKGATWPEPPSYWSTHTEAASVSAASLQQGTLKVTSPAAFISFLFALLCPDMQNLFI